jgi:flagellar biosynthetic protein FliR
VFLSELVDNAYIFFLLFARIFAMLSVAPLLSSSAFPPIARIALSLFTSVLLLPAFIGGAYPPPGAGLEFIGWLIGEVLLGLLQGFMLVVIYSAFQISGQFFSLQMGFGASQVFDPLAQIEIPVLGQVLNLLAMFVFISVGGFRNVFLYHIYQGVQALNAWEVLGQGNVLRPELIGGLGDLFAHSFIMALPILGALLMVSVSMGLLAKAAPQMNLLMIGFPISITVGFLMMWTAFPFLAQGFSTIIENGFDAMSRLIAELAEEGI